MSGFEVLGVVLGVVPLIISAIEHYEDILGPITTMRKYSKALTTFTTELNVQKDIFQNECFWILSPFTDAHELESMLRDPSHHLRKELPSNRSLNSSVQSRLGPSYGQIVNILNLIQVSLHELAEETKEFPEGLNKPTNATDVAAWKTMICERLKFSLSKSSLDTKLDRLRHRNQAFLALSEQVLRHNSTLWVPSQTQWTEKSADRTLEKIKTLRTASDSLHRAFGNLWTCPEHPGHSASMRLCLSTAELYTEADSKFTFEVALSNWEDEKTSRSTTLTVLEIQGTFGNEQEKTTRVRFDAGQIPISPGQQRSNTSELHRTPVVKEAKDSHRSRVRKAFRILRGKPETEAAESSVSQNLSTLPARPPPYKEPEPSPTPNLSEEQNLCSKLSTLTKQPSNQEKSIGYFTSPDNFKYLVYNKSPSTLETLSLSSVFLDQRREKQLSKADKWRLAGKLSMAALLYHSTPWLSASWKSDDILFFELEQAMLVKSTYLHSNPGFKAPTRASTTRSMLAQTSKNELIHRLALILLELEFSNTLPNLLKELERYGLFDKRYANAELRSPMLLLRQRAGEQMGTLYGRMVRMCLDCDFGLGLNDYVLDDVSFQKVFYSQIVLQFQERMPDYDRIWGET